MTRLAFAATLLASLAASSAQATTIDTFSFTQGGFTDGGVLSGSFTGTVESSGYIQRTDLSSFRVTYVNGPASSFGYAASFFSFSTSSASTLDFEAIIGIAGYACSGAAAAFGFDHCATGSLAGPVNGYVLGNGTADLATVTLISSIVQPDPQPLPIPGPVPAPQPQPDPVAVPEPGSAALLVGALLLMLGLSGGLRRRDGGPVSRAAA